MYSVTRRIKSIKQPRGGYIKPKDFTIITRTDTAVLHEEENINSILIGLAVDYLTRFMLGTSLNEVFRVSLLGAGMVNEQRIAQERLTQITGLDDNSIQNACQNVGYDVCFRAGAAKYRPVEDIHPDHNTCENIRIMVNRSLDFFQEYGPVVRDGFTFEGGYTPTVSTGDGDFLTKDTLWDFKVSKNIHTIAHTLQLFMYYLMGKRSIHSEFDSINQLGVFNPRLNTVAILNTNSIPSEVYLEVSYNVIGYTP